MLQSSTAARVKQFKRSMYDQYAKPDDVRGVAQVLETLLPIAALWYLAAQGPAWSYGYTDTAIATAVMSLFLLRLLTLMHECGHGSLFRSPFLNRAVGFLFGVISGMPQRVWANHHDYHHATNGNWAKYRGPLSVLSVDEYDGLSRKGQRTYRWMRNIFIAPIGGFLYLIFNPRLNWLRGSADLAWYVARHKLAEPATSVREHAAQFKTRYWDSAAEYRHMTLNNLALLTAWALMCWWVGPILFFTVYLVATSLAGGAAIVLFSVQHNFEHSYASADLHWDYDVAAIEGTAYLDFPKWLHWFTANVGYHHIHHICARIPGYRLAACHAEFEDLFVGVTRVKLADVVRSLTFLLWDTQARRLISVAEHRAALSAAG